MSATEPDSSREHELERRIEDIESSDPAAFGRFTVWDWTLCVAFAFALPVLTLWWFAP